MMHHVERVLIMMFIASTAAFSTKLQANGRDIESLAVMVLAFALGGYFMDKYAEARRKR